MYICHDKNGIITVASDHPVEITGQTTKKLQLAVMSDIIGRRVDDNKKKDHSHLRIAVVVNWNVPCGISTYTRYLVTALKPKVAEIRIFSEEGDPLTPDDESVVRCWKRGNSLRPLCDNLTGWKPDFTIVQHEYGIFPNACHFLQLVQTLSNMPHAITMHSVYEHLDKTVCSSAVKNMVVHSRDAKAILENKGHKNTVYVVPHGCLTFEDTTELWNIFQTPYAILQFGFGFFYKGVDQALEAVSLLKKTDKKFSNIFYCYLCAENPHNSRIHDQYYYYLLDRIKLLDIEDNVAIIRGYQDDQIINNYLRTAKLAIFPYVNNPNNMVYGASGAIRIAMANKIPIIASDSHLFDDLEGVLPRPSDVESLTKEIDKIFSSADHRNKIVENIENHIRTFSWDRTANEYLAVYDDVMTEKQQK